MSPWKLVGVACTLGVSVLMGCATHSAGLPNASAPTLQSHHWALQQALTPQGAPDPQWSIPVANGAVGRVLGLDFADDQRVSVSRLCNSMSGSYEVQGKQIQIGRLISTMMVCNDEALMKLERNVAQQLPKAISWKINGQTNPVLELQFEGGAAWLLQGTPTHETLYGNSERIFLEVGPQKAACSQPLMPNARCLQVREVVYDDKGQRQSEGPWMNYYGGIEGYQHQEGVRNTLRLKRFTRNPVPADGSKYVDVLDLVVESEIVR